MGWQDGYHAAISRQQFGNLNPMDQLAMEGLATVNTPPTPASKPKRKVSAYHKKLGREIKALRKRHMTKAGKWKKGWSQKRMMKTAHKNAKR